MRTRFILTETLLRRKTEIANLLADAGCIRRNLGRDQATALAFGFDGSRSVLQQDTWVNGGSYAALAILPRLARPNTVRLNNHAQRGFLVLTGLGRSGKATLLLRCRCKSAIIGISLSCLI